MVNYSNVTNETSFTMGLVMTDDGNNRNSDFVLSANETTTFKTTGTYKTLSVYRIGDGAQSLAEIRSKGITAVAVRTAPASESFVIRMDGPHVVIVLAGYKTLSFNENPADWPFISGTFDPFRQQQGLEYFRNLGLNYQIVGNNTNYTIPFVLTDSNGRRSDYILESKKLVAIVVAPGLLTVTLFAFDGGPNSPKDIGDVKSGKFHPVVNWTNFSDRNHPLEPLVFAYSGSNVVVWDLTELRRQKVPWLYRLWNMPDEETQQPPFEGCSLL